VAAAHVIMRSAVAHDFLDPSKLREWQSIFREMGRLGRVDDKRAQGSHDREKTDRTRKERSLGRLNHRPTLADCITLIGQNGAHSSCILSATETHLIEFNSGPLFQFVLLS
jgi:hypothetical protein